MVGLVDEVAIERLQVDFRGAEVVVAQSLADDGDGQALLMSRRGPAVTADIGRELQSAEQGAQFAERLVVEVDGVLVLAVHQPFVVQFGEDGQQVGVPASRRVSTDDVAHEGFDIHMDELTGLATDVGEDRAADIGLLEKSHVDKGDAPAAKAEQKKVAGELEAIDVPTQLGADGLLTVMRQARLDVEQLESADALDIDRALSRTGHSPVGAMERVTLGQSFANGLVPDGTEGAQVAGGGVTADAARLHPPFEIGHEGWFHLGKGYFLLSDALQELGEAAGCTGMVSGNPEAPHVVEVCSLGSGVIEKLAAFERLTMDVFTFHVNSSFIWLFKEKALLLQAK